MPRTDVPQGFAEPGSSPGTRTPSQARREAAEAVLDALSPEASSVAREILASLWADARAIVLGDLDPVRAAALTMLTKAGFVEEDTEAGPDRYQLSKLSLLGEPE